MISKRRRTRKAMAEINVVPYIDVMLVLLVIFMVTAPLLSQGVKIDLPKAPAKPVERSDSEPLVVSVDAAGLYEQTQVLVKGDANVGYGKVVAVMALLKHAGAGSVGLLTEPPETGVR